MEAGFAPGGDPGNPVRRRKPDPQPSPDVNTQERVANPSQMRISTSSASSNRATQGTSTHYTPLPTDHAQYRQSGAYGYVEHTGDAGNMYHENHVQGQYIKAPDQKVKRKSKKIGAPPAQDQYTPGYGVVVAGRQAGDGGDGYYMHHQQYNNTGQGYDAYSYEEAYDQITGTGGYNALYGVNRENEYGYRQGGEGTDDAYHHHYNEAGELLDGGQSNGAAHHQYVANYETYGDASAYGNINPSDAAAYSYCAELEYSDYQQPGIGEGNGVVAAPDRSADQKKKKKKKPKDGSTSQLQQVDGNYAHSERIQYNQQPSDGAYFYGTEQGYGDSQQVGVDELGNGAVAAPDHNADQRKKKEKKKSKDHLEQVDVNEHLESPHYNQPSDAPAYSYGAEQRYGDSQQAGVDELGNGVVAAPDPNVDQRKKKKKPKDGSTTSHDLQQVDGNAHLEPMIQDGFNAGSRSDQEGSHGSGHRDKSNAPRLDPLAEHICKTSVPKPSYQDVSMVVFDPQDQSTSLVDPGRFVQETVTGPRTRKPKFQNGSSTKNMAEDQRVFRDPLDEYLKQNQGNFSGIPSESMVVFDPKDKSVVDLRRTYNHQPAPDLAPGPPNYNQPRQYNNTRPRMMSHQPTYEQQQNLIRHQPQAVWGSAPHHHHHHHHPVDSFQGQSVAVQGQPNEKLMNCIHTVGVPCAKIATRIAMRQCVNGGCCCTIL